MAAALMSAFVSPPMPADLEAMPFLQKPFHMDEFLHTVRKVLRNATGNVRPVRRLTFSVMTTTSQV